MAITNHDRVGKAMELLKRGLGPFVDREFKSMLQGPSRGRASAVPGRGPSEREEGGHCIWTWRPSSRSCGTPGMTCSA